MVSVTHEEQMGLNSPAASHAENPRTEHYGDCILLVEDDMPTLRLERVILEEAGYLVEGVDSGEAALELISEEPPALVLLDIGLPGMDGFTTCRRIREFSQVPVVMVTGSKTAADQKQGTASGAIGYVTKPFLTSQLVEMVGEVISESSGYANGVGGNEDSQLIDIPIDTPLPVSHAAASVLPAFKIGGPIGEQAGLPGEDGAGLDLVQTDGDRPMESALASHNDDSPVPVEEEEAEDDPTEVAVIWNSQYSNDEQSPLEDPDSADSLPRHGDDTGSTGQHVNQVDPTSGVAGTVLADPTPADEPADKSMDEPDDELYEGSVRLMVSSSGPVKDLLNFVGELRQNTQLRLLRLVASQRSESMDIWLGLREPLPLITILEDIPGVSRVAPLSNEDGDDEERRVTVAVGE